MYWTLLLLLLLLLLSSSSSSSSSPLCRVFILIFLRQDISLGNTVLQIPCCYNSWYLYHYFQCWIYCILHQDFPLLLLLLLQHVLGRHVYEPGSNLVSKAHSFTEDISMLDHAILTYFTLITFSDRSIFHTSCIRRRQPGELFFYLCLFHTCVVYCSLLFVFVRCAVSRIGHLAVESAL